jgi:heme oxygenase
MALRDAVKEKHDRAEKHPFVVRLLSGSLSPKAYGAYLKNQAACYAALESVAAHLLIDFPDLNRAALIEQDAEELSDEDVPLYGSTKAYIQYVNVLPDDLLWAHIYVRHFADLYGGQLIKKVAPGACRMYEFKDRAALIAGVRARLSDDLGDEANKVFDFALALFDEVADAYDIRDA